MIILNTNHIQPVLLNKIIEITQKMHKIKIIQHKLQNVSTHKITFSMNSKEQYYWNILAKIEKSDQ